MVDNIAFLDARDSELLELLGYEPKWIRALVEEFIIPTLHHQPSWLLDSLMQLIFEKWSTLALNDSIKQHIASVPFISVRSRSGLSAQKRLNPRDVIDDVSGLAELYFDDEAVFGANIYECNGVNYKYIQTLGLKNALDANTAEERIKKFAMFSDQDLVFKRSSVLLQMLNEQVSFRMKPETAALLRLPAVKGGHECLLSPSECRPANMRALVEGVLGVTSIDIRQSLQVDFGWTALLGPSELASRVVYIVGSSEDVEDRLIPVFHYLESEVRSKLPDMRPYLKSLSSGITTDSWLPGENDGLYSPEKLFFDDVQHFEPYISRVPRALRKYKSILELFGVKQSPSPASLLRILNNFPLHECMKSKDFDIIISILNSLSKGETNESTEPRIPATDGKLYAVEEFQVRGDNNSLYAHPTVPESLTFKYAIPQTKRDLVLLAHLNASDIFEEYGQEEQLTTRISSTLQDYSLSTTLNEFIANAEDCGSATQVSWYLDSEDTRYPNEALLCRELQEWQSPSLFVYNDGVFSRSDFDSFINVGAGTKAMDPTKIGKYGLGSLTMYHFTDVPSMISGEYFVILDPSRRYLPLLGTKRRSGLRIPLSVMAREYEGHLRPFVGIGGYALGMSPFQFSKLICQICTNSMAHCFGFQSVTLGRFKRARFHVAFQVWSSQTSRDSSRAPLEI